MEFESRKHVLIVFNGLDDDDMTKLTHRKVQALRKAGLYGDGNNLYLQVKRSGTKSWALRYRINGRDRQMGLGSTSLVSLAEARELAHSARKQLHEGVDPLETRAASRARMSFQNAAEEFIDAHEGSWKNPVHRRQWRTTLETYVYPVFGDRPVDHVKTEHVLTCLRAIWHDKPETAKRVRGRIERVLDFAKSRGLRSGENPARWRGHLSHLLPQASKIQPVRNHAAISWRDMPEFMRELRAREGLSAWALEFTILTAARTGETLGMTYAEIEVEQAIWTVPAERMKASREHRVPLVPRALAVLPRIKGEKRIFRLSNMAMLELLRGMRPGYTVHGFRATFKTWAHEATMHPREIIEAALAHTVKGIEAHYLRGDALEKRRQLMTDWAKFLNC